MGLLRGEQILDFTNINRDCIKNEYVCAHIEIIDGAAAIETAQVYWTLLQALVYVRVGGRRSMYILNTSS